MWCGGSPGGSECGYYACALDGDALENPSARQWPGGCRIRRPARRVCVVPTHKAWDKSHTYARSHGQLSSLVMNASLEACCLCDHSSLLNGPFANRKLSQACPATRLKFRLFETCPATSLRQHAHYTAGMHTGTTAAQHTTHYACATYTIDPSAALLCHIATDLASIKATSCGVDTMTAPESGSRCPRPICASPVPDMGVT